MALSEDRSTAMRDGNMISLPVAAGVTIYAGALVARDASGDATPGAETTGILGVGRADAGADNAGGAAGDITVEVRKGVFKFDNSAAGDAISLADVGSDCYIVDDETVAATDGTGTRSVAGTVFDVDADGVWVRIS